MNAIKSDIGDQVSTNLVEHVIELDESVEALRNEIVIRGKLETQQRALEEERLQSGDSDLRERQEELLSVGTELDQVDQSLRDIERDPDGSEDDDTDALKALEEKIDDAERDLSEITDTLTLKNKTDLIRHVLDDAVQRARSRLSAKLTEETNSRIKQLLPRDPIEVESVAESLVLSGRRGASMGQTLAVGYAFLATLFSRGGHQLPFIVDSPAGALDLAVRPEVARLIPELCKQFIAFTISSERDRFVEPLRKAANDNVEHLTVFKKTVATAQLSAQADRSAIRNRRTEWWCQARNFSTVST